MNSNLIILICLNIRVDRRYDMYEQCMYTTYVELYFVLNKSKCPCWMQMQIFVVKHGLVNIVRHAGPQTRFGPLSKLSCFFLLQTTFQIFLLLFYSVDKLLYYLPTTKCNRYTTTSCLYDLLSTNTTTNP